MEFSKVFFVNISLLITFGYIFNLVYKYLFLHAAPKLKNGFSVALFIFSGWFTMLFGLQLTDMALFDLRFVPIIFATLVFRKPSTLIIIGTGIGLARLTFGINEASLAGFYNMTILGILASLLTYYFQISAWSYRRKAAAAILIINTVNILNIALLGVIPIWIYLSEIAIFTYPLGIVLSAFFIFIIRDFYKEQKRVIELRKMNIILRRQTRELREAKRALEEKARQLMLASKYKSEFLANMSHELKTPLNSIILLSEMIREAREERKEDGEGDEARYAEIIHAAGNDLLQLIDDILDLSKVEAGKMDVMLEKVVTLDMLQLIHDQFLPMAQQKGLAFELRVSEEVPGTLYTDALRVNQILRNLLVNAFKFTERGSVTLDVQLEREIVSVEEGRGIARRKRPWNLPAWQGRFNRDRCLLRSTSGKSGIQSGTRRSGTAQPVIHTREWLSFSVIDTGIGIEPEKQQLIFEAFKQADGAINRKYGGTGLGLSISLQLARLLGGSLSLTSRYEEGSKFTLLLPVLQEPE
ncbi:ATP-binding protein [Paenibacillus abyssi]|uniref:histidine kinase n=1 Tax=Paenibacillus abyssi TaxID=1340531 RepID=A0A917D1J9_9BACL|nr:ATP-binding protein [Paenibacillus abyssi]GGG06810.1 hypothetical protein GCM10010916_24670 [Paenibacillus abyssi]